ncbi:hypothetical protein [Segniliparus rugosus]|uniref:Uncharacterized protein n=1 Tax=Segniliparus rugosus (strain ATCC BAA-974 / DSM 45345 / CCUG 50838 / CIP 108380 / JCM 13579 / CDC 945) TaxID=679197 RepID=E5XTE5_SEGRC|nr:hypothetical protein [Segniliparus rugosus]EFV12376.2 hypothetical protein HMPREF9336_02767 [Segniliparus rugosus ATCC BAA-974]
MSALLIAHRAAGCLSLAAGALSVLGGVGPLLKVRSASALGEILDSGPVHSPAVLSAHWAALAGAFLLVAGIGLLVPGRAQRIRPAASVLWAAPVPAALSALRTASSAVEAAQSPDPLMRLAAPTLAFDWGAWLLVASVVFAGASGFACLVAGVLDREAWEHARELAEAARAEKGKRRKARREAAVEADPRERPPDRRAVALYAAAGAFGALGALLPLYVGPGFRSTWLPDVPFASQAFGQFLLALVVAASAVVGVRSRRSRQPALCAGCALSLVAYVAGYPFLSGNVPGSTPGPGFWAGLVGAALFAAAAGVAADPTSRLSRQSLGSLRRDQTKT